MSIDLSRVTGISDSRGVITEIKDSLGRVIWSGKKFVLVYDFGTNTPNKTDTSGNPYFTIDLDAIGFTDLPSGSFECNTLIVDGVEYELEYSSGGPNMPRYTPVDSQCPVKNLYFQKITIIGTSISTTVYQRDSNAHNVQIGYY